jgi:hypothetical protein
MAARTGAGTGVIVGLVVFVLSTIFLLVLTIVFYSRQQEALRQRDEAVSERDRVINRTQLGNEAYKAVLASATGRSQTGMEHLLESQRAIMTRVLGNPAATVEDLDREIASRSGGNASTSLRTVLDQTTGELRGARTEIEGLNSQIADQANTLAQQRALIEQAEKTRQEEIQALRDVLDEYINSVDTFGQDVVETKRQMGDLVRQLEATFDAEVNQLENTLDTARGELARAEQQLGQFRSMVAAIRNPGADPATLVDAEVLDSVTSDGYVFISRGRADHVALGMTFEVYDNASMIQPDANGNFSRGKASLQVVNVSETTSTAKVTRTVPGRPVVRGDVLANAVYDPSKRFTFLVHGKFDVDGDGRASETETDYLKSLIREWGGVVADGEELRGDMDFLLLGDQPINPAPLPDNPSPVAVEIYVKQKQAYEKYHRLMGDAMKAFIPVLNQNRFFILIGHTNA